jgi:hypothetical protein
VNPAVMRIQALASSAGTVYKLARPVEDRAGGVRGSDGMGMLVGRLETSSCRWSSGNFPFCDARDVS